MISPRLTLVGVCLALVVSSHADTPGLAASPSVFLREQAGSAVNWQPWDPALATRAKQEGRPVYVFVGYFLSELSRATCRQTFANAEVAAFLNANFICVLVDRDERPDIAAGVQHYLHTVKQQDGWPAHLWLTPEMQPFDGASYLPPSEEWGKPGFLKVARQARESWAGDPKACRSRASEAIAAMNAPPELPPASGGPSPKLETQLADAAAAWRATFDEANGGFGQAPKALEPELLRFLLGQAPADRDAALTTLRAVINGAVRDPLDGGFFPRSADAAWRLPYFQKTLPDQARLALALLDAARISGDAAFARAARGALDYALDRLALADGGFAAAEDGTGDESAAYYTWSSADIDAVLGADAAPFKLAYGVKPEGNVSTDDDPAGHFHGKNILRRVTPAGDAPAEAALASAAVRLRSARDKRPPPPRNDRATAGAHGLILAALSRAGAQLNEPRYLKAAARTFAVVQKEFVMSPDGDLHRMSSFSAAGAPVDYAAVALGCREFAQSGKGAGADALATRLLARAGHLFFDSVNGRYLATPPALPEGLFVRAPAISDPPAAETLALMAGAPAEQAAALKKALVASLDGGAPAAGDVLLALKQ